MTKNEVAWAIVLLFKNPWLNASKLLWPVYLFREDGWRVLELTGTRLLIVTNKNTFGRRYRVILELLMRKPRIWLHCSLSVALANGRPCWSWCENIAVVQIAVYTVFADKDTKFSIIPSVLFTIIGIPNEAHMSKKELSTSLSVRETL